MRAADDPAKGEAKEAKAVASQFFDRLKAKDVEGASKLVVPVNKSPDPDATSSYLQQLAKALAPGGTIELGDAKERPTAVAVIAIAKRGGDDGKVDRDPIFRFAAKAVGVCY